MLYIISFAAISLAEEQARTPRIYSIYDISVDETARNAAQARSRAIIKGQRKALQRLFRRIILNEDQTKLPRFEDRQVSELVSGFQVEGERSSAVRYIATLTVHFSRQKIHETLGFFKIPHAETLGSSLNVLAVLKKDAFVMLWEKDNLWRDAWAAYDGINNLVPLGTVESTNQNRLALSSWQAYQGRAKNLEAFAAQHQINDLLIAIAEVKQESGGKGWRLHLRLKRGLEGLDIYEDHFASGPQGGLEELYQKAIQSAADWIDDKWKGQVLIHHGFSSRIMATVPLTGAEDWLVVNKKLGQISLVRNFKVKRLNVHKAVLDIEHAGEVDQLILLLRQSGLDLVEQPAGDWSLVRLEGQN